jgi:hypothetical protein
MRRVVYTIAASALMAGAVPATALAHHHHHHHGKAQLRAHHNRLRHFGHQTTPPTSTNSADNAGTVQSFTGGVLTLKLNDNSTVQGMVTNDTELECTAPQSSTTTPTTHEDGDRQGDNGPGDDQGGDNSPGDDNGQGDDDQGEDQNQQQNCSTADLTPGAVVHEAELRIGSTGATWKKVELVS